MALFTRIDEDELDPLYALGVCFTITVNYSKVMYLDNGVGGTIITTAKPSIFTSVHMSYVVFNHFDGNCGDTVIS